MGFGKIQVGMKNLFYRKHSRRGVLAEAGSTLSLLAIWLISAALICLLANVAAGQNAAPVNLGDPDVRQQIVEHLAAESQQRKANAWQIAKSQGWPAKERIGDRIFELMAIEGGRVYVYQTCNVNAAISIGANLIRNTSPYNVNGADLTVGIWDGGAVRATHQEFGGRVAVMDGAGIENHSTHVGGTIGAAGIVANALGMAPSVLIDSYEWTGDEAEMTSRAMSYPNEPDKIQISNHSYGYACGWEYGSFSGSTGPHWFGTWGERESDYFGIYTSDVAQWDELCYNAPYYLPFKAAGNDRSDKAPSDGTRFWYIKQAGINLIWGSRKYKSSNDPYDDGWDNGGFDTIMTKSGAKNIMTDDVNNAMIVGTVTFSVFM